MGMMGPVAGGWIGGGSSALWILVLALGAVVLLVQVLPALGHGSSRLGGTSIRGRRPATPEELLGERYARGDVGWPGYREGLVGLLKDRYVRGELEVAEYEDRLGHLLEELPAQRRSDQLTRQMPQATPEPPATAYPADGPLPREPRPRGCC